MIFGLYGFTGIEEPNRAPSNDKYIKLVILKSLYCGNEREDRQT